MFRNIVILFILATSASFGETFRQGKIVGGEDVDIQQVPYQVSLVVKGFGHHCGGSIISKDFILTAAHCIRGTDPAKIMQVRVGSTFSAGGGTIFDIESAKYHGKFNDNGMECDVAVLKLKQPLTFGPGVAPIKIVDKNFVAEDGAECVVTGWGKTTELGPASKRLKRVVVPLIKQEVCAAAYENFQQLTENMLCAGILKGGKDSCQGDSGGPLTIKGQLAGVVSWGQGCARPNFPGVYARLSVLKDWIEKAMDELMVK